MRKVLIAGLVCSVVLLLMSFGNPKAEPRAKDKDQSSTPRTEEAPVLASAGVPALDTVRIATGLSQPLYLTAPPGDFNRVFVVEQRGSNGVANRGDIRVINISTNPPTLLGPPFLSIIPVQPPANPGNEQGFLGLAFDPDYMTNGVFYTNHTDETGTTRVRRYVDSNSNDNVFSGTTTDVLSLAQPFSNHNGGWMGFGPDGFLYISTGDGGSANDPGNRGQDTSVLLGKMLRIDGDGDDFPLDPTKNYAIPNGNPFAGITPGEDEIWAYGLRNPWRASFDRATDEFYIADVGQNVWEEISVQPGNSTGGENYGWRCYEGNNAFNTTGCQPANTMVFPVHVYSHGGNPFRCSITGGYVYRGSAIPGLEGTYFFADFCSDQIWTFDYEGAPNPTVTDRTSELAPSGPGVINDITSFGEDAAGEIYICDRGGEVYKIIPAPPGNNTCAGALVATLGNTPFSSSGASTDGPDEPNNCTGGPSIIQNDIWFKFPSTCDGTLTVSVCDAGFNTMLAAYVACPTGPDQSLACNNDFCGKQSQISFPVSSGVLYRIRLGGADGETGSGTMVITCTPDDTCTADIAPKGGDGQVNVDDLLAVINAWGPCADPCPPSCNADIAPSGGGDCEVNVDDLLAVINQWGPCP